MLSCELPSLFPLQDAGEKQVASLLGIQSARAATRPRPFMRLAKQNIAMQVRIPPVASGLSNVLIPAKPELQLCNAGQQKPRCPSNRMATCNRVVTGFLLVPHHAASISFA